MNIRLRKHRSGRTSWQLDCGRVNGKRVQLSFKTKDEAEAALSARRSEKQNYGMIAFSLSYEDRLRMMVARDKLAKVGATIDEAVEFFLKHARPAKDPINFETLLQMCLEAKYESGTSPEYRRQIKSVGGSFALHAGNALRLAHEIRREDVEAWLKANRWAPKTHNNYLTDLRTIFAFGIGRGYLTANPCEGVDRKKTLDGEIRFLSVDACERLLRRAAEPKPPLPRFDKQGRWLPLRAGAESFQDFLPLLVIGLFCGPRPDKELGGMPHTDIKLEQRLIVISAGRAKSRRRRTVDLPPNAIAWLEFARDHGGWNPQAEGTITPPNFKRRWKRLRQECGLFDDWPHDALRHTFATYEYASTQNEAALQVKMGHRNAHTLHAHYRGLTTPAEAARFWALRP